MLLRSAVLIALCTVLVGCEVGWESWGSATFFVENQTASGFRMTMTMVPQERNGTVESSIPAFTRAQVHATSIIGVNPRPSDAFEKIEVRDSTTGIRLYVQDPIDDDAWIRVAPHQDEADYYAAEYTLVISEGDLLAP